MVIDLPAAVMSEPERAPGAGGGRRAADPAGAGDEPAGARLRRRPAASGEEALDVAARHHPDAVILDLGLPGIAGIEVVAGAAGLDRVPIIILSARGAEHDKVAALDAGADDYVTKPFGMDELLARLRAALRRGAPPDEQPAGGRDPGLRRRPGRQAGPRERRRGPADAHRVGHGRGPGPQRRPAGVPAPAAPGRVGASVRRRRPTTCGSTWPTSAASSSPSPSAPRYFVTEPGMGYRFEG